MGDDLVLICWNVQKKSLSSFTDGSDTLELITRSIAKTVAKAGAKGADTPFVSYLLEMTGSRDNLEEACKEIKKAYKAATGEISETGDAIPGLDIDVTVTDLGGSSATRESIITMSRGVEVENTTLDIQSAVEPYIQRDVDQAYIRQGERLEERPPLARAVKKGDSYPVEHFRANVKGKEWFRNGVTSDIKFEGTSLRVSTAHSAGPNFVEQFPQSVDATMEAASDVNSDLLMGDFNRDGNYAGENHFDTLRPHGKGTTFSKSATKEEGEPVLGTRMRDRVFQPKEYSFWEFTTHEPKIYGRSALEPPLTDHAMICTGVSRRTSEAELRLAYAQYPDPDFWAEIGVNIPEDMQVEVAELEGLGAPYPIPPNQAPFGLNPDEMPPGLYGNRGVGNSSSTMDVEMTSPLKTSSTQTVAPLESPNTVSSPLNDPMQVDPVQPLNPSTGNTGSAASLSEDAASEEAAQTLSIMAETVTTEAEVEAAMAFLLL